VGAVELAAHGGGAALHVQAADFGAFVAAAPQIARKNGIRLWEVLPADESLESVFAYLVTS
jgi:ABC-2 type transport system ATP-binding protein